MSATNNDAAALSQHAATIISIAQEQTGLSLLELAAALRIAAVVCAEQNSIHEQALMVNKLRGWKP